MFASWFTMEHEMLKQAEAAQIPRYKFQIKYK